MKFKDCTTNLKVIEAISIADKLLSPYSKMLNEIYSKDDFKYESGQGATIANKLVYTEGPVKVFFYKPWNPWTKAIGYSDGIAIHINKRIIDSLEHADLVGLLLHEWSHHCGFHHGNNYKTKDKVLYSVPYYISENVGKWI
jgi:hypothetical protein